MHSTDGGNLQEHHHETTGLVCCTAGEVLSFQWSTFRGTKVLPNTFNTRHITFSHPPLPPHSDTYQSLALTFLVSITTMVMSRNSPMPQAPATAAQVTDILTQISSATQRGDGTRCVELVSTIKALARENELNRKHITSSDAGRVLAAAFSTFAGKNSVPEKILSAMTAILPLDQEARWHIGSQDSLKCIVSIADSSSPSARINAVMIIIELAPSMPGIAATDRLVEALVEMIKKPSSAKLTKAALVAAFYLISSNREVAARFAELGAVSILLDMLVDAEKSVCEKVIGVLDRMFGTERGREAAYNNALVMPVLVKKMFRVSEAATEFAVSALWKLCREGGRGSMCVVEALQVGAFQKVLMLLQVGCSEGAKKRASNLLKVLNASKGEFECVDSMDFRGLRRPL